MISILDSIRRLPGVEAITQTPPGGHRISMGLPRSVQLPFVASLRSLSRSPFLIVTGKSRRALDLWDELNLWLPESKHYLLPEPTALFYEDLPWGENTRRERLAAFAAVTRNFENVQPSAIPVVIAPVRALMARSLPPDIYQRYLRTIEIGDLTRPEMISRDLVAMGYESANTVSAVGYFARRGGILDVWPQSSDQPLRLEFFGDQIESIRYFNPASQRSKQEIDAFQLGPAREFIHPGNSDLGGNDKVLHELHIPLLHAERACFIDHMPPDAMVFVDDWQEIQDTIEQIEEQSEGVRQDAIESGQITKDFPPAYISKSEIADKISALPFFELGPYADTDASSVSSRFSVGRRYGGKIKDFLRDLHAAYVRGDDLVVVSRQAARLADLWLESHFEEATENSPRFIEGSLHGGWTLRREGAPDLTLFSDGEIFGWRRPQPRQRTRPSHDHPEQKYSDLKFNELVVHIDHGIGRFKGLVQREVDGIEHEYLCVEYAGGDTLYVPVHQADRLTRYVGSKHHRVAISRLGGAGWGRTTSRVKTAVLDVAEELLELYARRKATKGFAFSPDGAWQKELEASFPYIETRDQLQALEEIKRDMESELPMDRLICGDVGYGKTEVALRAAFKAVLDGRQVAMLVPTTILAQQHFRTFQRRLAAFPVEVEMLSRFRSTKQQKEIVERIASGNIDIVIGTHRLIQKDVSYKSLGLVIIDEEQRFGVSDKEYLKQLRAQVDVLTLTATPIPRTLYMTLTGARDISNIDTPPEERLPVKSHVGVFSPALIRQAVLRELERGGQVFFVHNRVNTIRAMSTQIAGIVPEARIEIAHGQMSEAQLSARMQNFINGDTDILLTTTIIEAGLDIPNANTLIVDRADTFGLAQLYQLKGRVGRGAQRAYAFFFRHSKIPPTQEGRQRLEAIAENSNLGAGYSIAMRDLEIRGAGDLLGTRQHGHIAAVGFHLYTRLLNKAIEQMRQTGKYETQAIPASMSIFQAMINIDLPITVNIPPSYVPDNEMRLGLYRRLADIRKMEEVDKLEEEFSDRFGKPPIPVTNLIYQLRVKLLAERIGVESIHFENGQIAIRYPKAPGEKPQLRFSFATPGIRISKRTVWMGLKDEPDWKQKLLDFLERAADG